MSNAVDRMTQAGREMFLTAKTKKEAELFALLPSIQSEVEEVRKAYSQAEGAEKTPYAERYRILTIQVAAIQDFEKMAATPFSFEYLRKVGL